jgi:replicative DNA helicase
MSETETKFMPAVIAAEKAVLSCMMQQPQRFIGRAAAEGIDHACFHLTGQTYTALMDFFATDPEMIEIEITAFVTHLQLNGMIDRCGGASQICDVAGAAVTLAGWSVWGGQLRECKARRMALLAAQRLGEAESSQEAIDEVKSTLDALTKAVSGRLRAIDSKTAAKDFIERFEADNEFGDLPGSSTGLTELDAASGGMRPGEFWVFCGKPSRGKSVIMLQIAAEFALRGETVAIFTLEMMQHEIMGRLTSVVGNVDYGGITQPKTMIKSDLLRIEPAVAKLIKAPLWIDSSASQNLETIEAEAERIRDISGSLSLVVVDYLQLIRGGRQRGESREEEVARASGGLKQLAKKLNCPVISASQLNEDGKTRESRAIEQDADALLFIVEDGIKVGKLRNGKRDTVLKLFLHGEFQKFKTYQPVPADD